MTRNSRSSWVCLWLVTAVLASPACGGGQSVDPVAKAIESYKAAVEPVIQKSEAISKVFVQIVLEDKGKPDPDKAAKRIETEVLPRAKTFADEVSAIQPSDPNIAEIHKFLVQVATLRLEGYQKLIKGYNGNDLELFAQGKKAISESKIQENTYIERARQLFAAYGYKLDYFSPAATDPFAAQ